jgi:hypothetical protein
MPSTLKYSDQFIKHETRAVLGTGSKSTHRTSAFGARSSQPHMSILLAGSGIERDLVLVGAPFRERIGDLTFDKFAVEVVNRNTSAR